MLPILASGPLSRCESRIRRNSHHLQDWDASKQPWARSESTRKGSKDANWQYMHDMTVVACLADSSAPSSRDTWCLRCASLPRVSPGPSSNVPLLPRHRQLAGLAVASEKAHVYSIQVELLRVDLM